VSKGKWTEWWDDERKRWVKVYIELPAPLARGSATGVSGKDEQPTIFGPDNKPLVWPAGKRIGFKP